MGNKASKMELETRINDTCELMAALAAYQAPGKDRDTLIRRIRLMAGVSMERASYYYDSFENEGVKVWVRKVNESIEQLIG